MAHNGLTKTIIRASSKCRVFKIDKYLNRFDKRQNSSMQYLRSLAALGSCYRTVRSFFLKAYKKTMVDGNY